MVFNHRGIQLTGTKELVVNTTDSVVSGDRKPVVATLPLRTNPVVTVIGTFNRYRKVFIITKQTVRTVRIGSVQMVVFKGVIGPRGSFKGSSQKMVALGISSEGKMGVVDRLDLGHFSDRAVEKGGEVSRRVVAMHSESGDIYRDP